MDRVVNASAVEPVSLCLHTGTDMKQIAAADGQGVAVELNLTPPGDRIYGGREVYEVLPNQ